MSAGTRGFGQQERALLKAGASLPGDLLDADGEVVFAKATPIDDALLHAIDEKMSSDLRLGANWPEAGKGKPMSQTKAPSQGEDGKKSNEESRGARRYEWRQVITIELEELQNGQSRLRTLEIDTCDISTRGLGFLADGFIYPGTRMYLTFCTLPDRPRVTGEVQYCAYDGAGKHKVGVRFLSPAEAIRHTRRLASDDQESSEKSAA